MPHYYFFKAVTDYHIRGVVHPTEAAVMGARPGNGIRIHGLDPDWRNAFGGATATARSGGRELTPADSSGRGQCLTGSQEDAIGYCKTRSHVLLRITLDDGNLAMLVRSAADHATFDSMQQAVDARECTAIRRILPASIEYLTEDDAWQPIAAYKHPPPKEFD